MKWHNTTNIIFLNCSESSDALSKHSESKCRTEKLDFSISWSALLCFSFWRPLLLSVFSPFHANSSIYTVDDNRKRSLQILPPIAFIPLKTNLESKREKLESHVCSGLDSPQKQSEKKKLQANHHIRTELPHFGEHRQKCVNYLCVWAVQSRSELSHCTVLYFERMVLTGNGVCHSFSAVLRCPFFLSLPFSLLTNAMFDIGCERGEQMGHTFPPRQKPNPGHPLAGTVLIFVILKGKQES